MNEFVLMLVIYVGSAFSITPFGYYPDKLKCEEYAKQIRGDLAEPGKTIKTTCLPQSAMEKSFPKKGVAK